MSSGLPKSTPKIAIGRRLWMAQEQLDIIHGFTAQRSRQR